MLSDYISAYNDMYTYIIENVNYMKAGTNVRSASNTCLELFNRGYIDFFAFAPFKDFVKQGCESTYANLQATGQINLVPPTSTGFSTRVGQAVATRIDNFMKNYLLQYNIDQANSDGIAYNKVVFVMLSTYAIFQENVGVARQAYEDVYPSFKDLINGSDAINSGPVMQWIAAILLKYQELTSTTTTTTTSTTTTPPPTSTTTTDTTTSTATATLTTTSATTTTGSDTSSTTTTGTSTTTSTTTSLSATTTPDVLVSGVCPISENLYYVCSVGDVYECTSGISTGAVLSCSDSQFINLCSDDNSLAPGVGKICTSIGAEFVCSNLDQPYFEKVLLCGSEKRGTVLAWSFLSVIVSTE